MTKLCSCLLALALACGTSAAAYGQALPTAIRAAPWQVGGGISYGSTDIFPKDVTGYTIYGTYDFSYHLGVEVDYHSMSINTPDDFTESSFFGGVRYVWHYNRLHPYVKIMAGEGHAKFERDNIYPFIGPQPIPASFFAYAGGGGVDYNLSHHLNVRADLDYQKWPGFKANGLTPYTVTIGIAYRPR